MKWPWILRAPVLWRLHSWSSTPEPVWHLPFLQALYYLVRWTHSQKTCRTTYLIWVGLKYRRHPRVSSHTLNPDQRKRLQTRITSDLDYRLSKSHACVNHILVYLPSLMSLYTYQCNVEISESSISHSWETINTVIIKNNMSKTRGGGGSFLSSDSQEVGISGDESLWNWIQVDLQV